MDGMAHTPNDARAPHLRGGIGALMASVAASALVLATIQQASPSRVYLTFSATLAVLLAASLRAMLGPSPGARRWWAGFGIFGWAHLLLIGSQWREQMPTAWLIDVSTEWWLDGREPFLTRGPGCTDEMRRANMKYWDSAVGLASLYLTLMLALFGGMLTGRLAGRDGGREPSREGADFVSDEV